MSLVEQALRVEPLNLRYVNDALDMLSTGFAEVRPLGELPGALARARAVADGYVGRMEGLRRRGLLGRAELGAVLAGVAESLYFVVERYCKVTLFR